MLLLKAHLLVEEHVNHALRGILPNAEALNEARLTFSQKLRVIRAIDYLRYAEDALDAAERLNRLRNKLAHQLEPVGIEDGIASFAAKVEDWPGTTIKKRDSGRLKFVRSIIHIGAQIDACRGLYKILGDFTVRYTLGIQTKDGLPDIRRIIRDISERN